MASSIADGIYFKTSDHMVDADRREHLWRALRLVGFDSDFVARHLSGGTSAAGT